MIRLILTATAIITSSSAIYFYIFHERLSKRIAHKSHLGTLTASTKPSIESIPETVFSDEYFTIYDHASESVPRACLPSSEATDLLFKRLVRRNMTAFSRFPQALMLAMASKKPEQKQSFKTGYLAALDFEVGDLVCGVYRVVVRRRDRVEFEIKMETVDFVEGRLAISYEESSSLEEEGKVVFCSETVMWRRADEGRRMPLERPVLRWMHETASWWLMDSGEYTNKIRLAGPESSVSCNQIKPSHDLLLSTQPSMCVQCESEWADNVSQEDDQTQTAKSYRTIEGLDATGHVIEVSARMVSDPTPDDRETSSTDHSDDGQLCSRAVVSESESDYGSLARSERSSSTAFKLARTNSGSSEIAADPDSFASITIKTSPAHLAHSGCESDYSKESVETESPDTEGTGCATPSNVSSCDTDSSGSSLCGSSLIRYNILKLRIDEYFEKRQRRREVDTDHQQPEADDSGVDVRIYLADVDHPHPALGDRPPADSVDSPEVDYDSSEESALDIDLVQQRIEATVLKCIEENDEKKAREKAMSKLLDTALLKKDRDDRREKNAELGIEEDPHIWDTESLVQMWEAKNSIPAPPDDTSIAISPRNCTSPKSQQAPPGPDPRPQKHMYMGSMFASEESAYQRGLREIRPYGDYSGEWEGFMMADSEDDANRQGLLDPIHVRGCCAERRADFHLYYGVMHAPSEVEAEKRWLEDIRRIPGEDGKFYGLLRADDLHHARAMGLSDIRHPWECCKDAHFTMPERVRHRYTGFMSAISLKEVGHMGLCDAAPVPGECDAFQMGLKDPEHDRDCCAKAEVSVSISEAGQYTYYGYMYARSEEEVVDRGLKDALLVPGFEIKYSGNLQAGSEEEAKAMGLFEPSRIK
ncbi:hypothetical protein DTO012A7_962 [Penicillium roqueforti]|nr:hypothetical protein CBS147372_3820 [Penicillium roqueforti]KAI3163505.1 hypothetical protein CBS147317_3717 [Penicillium roqueforti]KAI3244983.1 hypothetical protein DTO012A7_962 [Penicillium roqueforti]KAI3276895.1 hypothetical protein CBS147309_2877 [Penicillium roqueforti]